MTIAASSCKLDKKIDGSCIKEHVVFIKILHENCYKKLKKAALNVSKNANSHF